MSPPSKRNVALLQAIRSLDNAINAHLLWLSEFHRGVICKSDPDPSVAAPDSHTLCVFGRWYYGLDRGEWQQWSADLDQIGALHQGMHDQARNLVLLQQERAPIDSASYDKFINEAIRFKLSIRTLQFRVINDVCLVDHLTGAWNRGALFQRIAEEYERRLREGGSSCLCMMDLDHFKSVNDSHGHIAGDKVLQSVVETVKLRLRPYDSVFRYGGEEFLFCLPNISADDAVAVMDRIRTDIEATPIPLKDGHAISITASFGVSPLCTTLAIEESIEMADRALFCAKATGRNKVCRWDSTALA